MKTFATLLTLAAAATAATVKLEQTACLSSTKLESFDVTLGTLFAKDLPSTCGLKLVSANGATLDKINCQAYKDAAGTQKGSAEFNSTSPALIATNPVQIGAVKCVEASLAGAAAAAGAATTTTLATTATASKTESTLPSATPNAAGVNSTLTGPAAGNGTNPSATNSPPQPSPSGNPNGAERLGLSLGVVAAGLAVFVL